MGWGYQTMGVPVFLQEIAGGAYSDSTWQSLNLDTQGSLQGLDLSGVSLFREKFNANANVFVLLASLGRDLVGLIPQTLDMLSRGHK